MTEPSVYVRVHFDMDNPKPLIQAACIVDKILLEKDDAATLVRIIDTIEALIPKDTPKDARPGFPINFFIRLSSDTIKGKGVIAVYPRRPDATRGGKFQIEVEFPGDGRNIQIKTAFMIVNPQRGTYWFDVLWNEELLTSVPLHVTLSEVPAMAAASEVEPMKSDVRG